MNAADAVELGEFLQFLDDWLTAGREATGALLARFTGCEAYSAGSLRSDLARVIFLLGARDGEGLFSHPGTPGPVSLKGMQAPVFEETRPADYLTRIAASDLGKAYKRIAAGEMAIRPGDVILDLGCGPGADLPAFAEATGSSGRVLGIDHDPDAVRQATERTAGLPQVEVREGDIRSLGIPAGSVDKVHTDRVLQHVQDLRVAQIKDDYEGWARRRLDGVMLGYLFLDASFFRMHPGSPAEPVLAAWGITTDGKPAFIGLGPGAGESFDAWGVALDRPLLDKIRLDHAAESASRRGSSTR